MDQLVSDLGQIVGPSHVLTGTDMARYSSDWLHQYKWQPRAIIRPATAEQVSEVVKLAKVPNIVGIKEASGDLAQAMEILRVTPENFLIISGDDMIALPMVLMGGHGVISVIGQGYPAKFSQMIQAARQGDVRKAQKIHYDLMPVIDMIFEQGNPSGIKALLHKKGICLNRLRLPLVPVDSSLEQRIEEFATESSAH